eukprot:JP443475.1.p2 GENE.JP443475.1~~JP443475.1.p2  ORF type:complete len:58 (-),score=6.77 JP443475.1:40-213(-)
MKKHSLYLRHFCLNQRCDRLVFIPQKRLVRQILDVNLVSVDDLFHRLWSRFFGLRFV